MGKITTGPVVQCSSAATQTPAQGLRKRGTYDMSPTKLGSKAMVPNMLGKQIPLSFHHDTILGPNIPSPPAPPRCGNSSFVAEKQGSKFELLRNCCIRPSQQQGRRWPRVALVRKTTRFSGLVLYTESWTALPRTDRSEDRGFKWLDRFDYHTTVLLGSSLMEIERRLTGGET